MDEPLPRLLYKTTTPSYLTSISGGQVGDRDGMHIVSEHPIMPHYMHIVSDSTYLVSNTSMTT